MQIYKLSAQKFAFVLIILACLVLLSACGPRSGTFGEYYVSMLGDDVRGNGSPSNPWRTIQYALLNWPFGNLPNSDSESS